MTTRGRCASALAPRWPSRWKNRTKWSRWITLLQDAWPLSLRCSRANWCDKQGSLSISRGADKDWDPSVCLTLKLKNRGRRWQNLMDREEKIINKCVVSFKCCHLVAWKNAEKLSVQFNPVAQSCPTLCDPMNRSTPGLSVHHQLPKFIQTHVHRVNDAIQPSHLLSSPSLPAPNPSQHQGLFQWVNSSHEVAKVLEFQLQHQSFQWTPALISFRMDWLDLLAIQGTLNSLFQHHSSKLYLLFKHKTVVENPFFFPLASGKQDWREPRKTGKIRQIPVILLPSPHLCILCTKPYSHVDKFLSLQCLVDLFQKVVLNSQFCKSSRIVISVVIPGASHGCVSLPLSFVCPVILLFIVLFSSVCKASAWNAGDLGLIPGSGRSPGEENSNPLQFSCLENPMDRRAWRATVRGIARVGHDLALSFLLFKEVSISIHSLLFLLKGNYFVKGKNCHAN